MKSKVEVIMEFNPDGSCRVVTVKGIPDVKKCKAMADQFAYLNGKPIESTRGTTADAFVKAPVQQQQKLGQ